MTEGPAMMPDGERAALATAFLERAGWATATRSLLAGDASFRRYDRLRRGRETAVLMDAPPPHEDVCAFERVARHLVGLGYSAPRILAVDPTAGFLLLEDLGDDTYTRRLAAGADEETVYALAIDLLADLHGRPRQEVLPSGVAPPYDDRRLLDEARLLTDWYMPAVFGRGPSDDAVAHYETIWRALFRHARMVPETLVLRDFHVDNLLLLPDRCGVAACGLLDFQDAVVGPVTYDLVSLLEDARRDMDTGLVQAMRQRYLESRPELDPQAVAGSWAVLAAQRHAKVIGIFTRLARRDGKPRYLPHIARVWRLLERALAHPDLTAMRDWFDHHIPAERRLVPK